MSPAHDGNKLFNAIEPNGAMQDLINTCFLFKLNIYFHRQIRMVYPKKRQRMLQKISSISKPKKIFNISVKSKNEKREAKHRNEKM